MNKGLAKVLLMVAAFIIGGSISSYFYKVYQEIENNK